MGNFSEKILGALGWKVGPFTPKEDKYILIVAPHTSWMDFAIGKLAFNTKGIPAVFFIKKEFFVFPLGLLLKKLGGMPIDRKHASSVVEHTASIVEKSRRIAVIITPEGTRKRNPDWKKGFYYLAKRTGIPVYAGKIDYGKKSCDILPGPVDTSKPFVQVMQELEARYQGTRGRHPENFNFYHGPEDRTRFPSSGRSPCSE